MSLTLKQFKKAISGDILTRGRNYYLAGRVVDLSFEEDEEWTAEVLGTDRYEVHIRIERDGTLACECDCPYDYGPYCKHIAAVLYAIEEAFPEYAGETTPKKGKRRQTKLEKLATALDRVPAEELRQLLISLAADHRDILNHLLLQTGAVGDKPSDYRALVKDALRPPPGNHGFLDYRGAMQAAGRVNEVVSRAEAAMDTAPEQALVIYQVILEESVKALQSADDSSGMLSGIVADALEGLARCAERLPPRGRETLFRYYLDQGTAEQYGGWDWSWDMVGSAADMAQTPEQRAAVEEALTLLATPPEDNSYRDFIVAYNQEKADRIRLKMVRRLDGEFAALRFIEDHKSSHPFRRMLIEHHLAQSQLDQARDLALEGIAAIKRSGERLPGIVLEYRQFLVQVALAQQDRRTVFEESAILWQHNRGERYYHLYREAVPPEYWNEMRQRLLTSADTPPYLAAWAYAQDGLWEEVRDIALVNGTVMENYRKEMEARFPEMIADAYRRQIDRLLKEVTNRDTYQDAAAYLHRLKEMGFNDLATEIALTYINRFPQRRAMVEELKKTI